MKKDFFKMWFIVGLFVGLAAVIFFIITYLNNQVLCDLGCRQQNEVTLALIFASLSGAFVGSLTYYFISEKYEKRIGKIHKYAKAAYKFLDPDERKIMEKLVKNKGELFQKDIPELTGLSRVQVSRVLSDLEEMQVINKDKAGMTNKITLEEDIARIFI